MEDGSGRGSVARARGRGLAAERRCDVLRDVHRALPAHVRVPLHDRLSERPRRAPPPGLLGHLLAGELGHCPLSQGVIRVNLALIEFAGLSEGAGNGTRQTLLLTLEEITQPKLGRGENVGFKNLSNDFSATLDPPVIHPAWDVLEQMRNLREAFPFAIRGDVCSSLRPSRIR